MSGPFFFKWVDAGALPWDAGEHIGEDEEILSFDISHEEGDFAQLEIEIENPRVGLLSPGRKLWAWISYDNGTTIVPMFYGRLVGIPEDLQAEAVQLTFIARPIDFDEQKRAIAETLKVAPYWDPIWFNADTRDDPDNVLESRPMLWHIDRITHEVSASDILHGEDGLLDFGEDDAFYDSVRVSFGAAPLRNVEVRATVGWDQKATGGLDIAGLFPNSIATFTGKSLIENWPKPGTSIGGGWEVKASRAYSITGDIAPAVYGYYNYLQRMAPEFHNVTVPEWAGDFSFTVSGGGSGYTYQSPAHVLRIPMTIVKPEMTVGFDTSRKRTEGLAFTLSADIQPILTEPGDEERLLLSFSSDELVAFIDPPSDDSSQPTMPIGDLRASSYFNSDRGALSIEYLICLARSRLLSRARTVEVEFEIDFRKGVEEGLSCRKSGFLVDYRLPGGSAGGKIISYSLSANGDSGELMCEIKLGCSIGRGTIIEGTPGEPLWVDDDYIEDDYQQRENEFTLAIAGEVAYSSINGLPIQDDGIDLFKLEPSQIVRSIVIENEASGQRGPMGETAGDTGEVFERLNAVPTTVTITLVPLTGGPFDNQFQIVTSDLSVPKTIDLEDAGAS